MVSPSANATDLRGRESMSAMIVFVWWCQGEIWPAAVGCALEIQPESRLCDAIEGK
jgi:hypothetical protein